MNELKDKLINELKNLGYLIRLGGRGEGYISCVDVNG